MDDKNKLAHVIRYSLNICRTCDKYEECEDIITLIDGTVDKIVECAHYRACVRAYKLGMQDGQ